MKTKYTIITVVFILLGSGFWWFLSGERRANHHFHDDHKKKKKISHYLCPMHPQITSDRPGSCSICGMDLVSAEDKEDNEVDNHIHATDEIDKSESNAVGDRDNPTGHTDLRLSLRKQQMIGIKLTKVTKKKLFKSIRAPGRIAFDPELYTAQSEYLEALKQWRNVKNSPIAAVKESSKQMIHSSKIRLKVLGLSEGQIRSFARKGFLSEGLLVSGSGQDNWIYADVFEVDLPYIKKGFSVKITANFLQGRTLPGKVISVDQVINPDTRTAKVRIQLLKKDAFIRPESYVNVTILAPLGEQIAIPLEAIMDTGREIFVFVKKNKGRFSPRKVSILLETDDDAAIGNGLEVGEEVVIGGNFMLDSESRLKAVIQGK